MWFFLDVDIQPAAPELHFLDWFECWLNGNEDYFRIGSFNSYRKRNRKITDNWLTFEMEFDILIKN